jgi:enoyl-CoA hydratase|eukprot:Stramenopile-MAST_4_protein_5488
MQRICVRFARPTVRAAARRTLVTTTEHGETGNVALVTMDDGKMNAFSFDMLSAVHSALDGCAEAGAVVITGNEKCLSAGFDLSVMGKGPSKEAGEMLRQGCDLMLRIAEFPRPVLLAVPGHAMALGAIMLFTGDLRVGPRESPQVKIGLNEVHIGMPLPRVGLELARWRLSPNALTRSTTLGHVYAPEEALGAGYLDELVDRDDVIPHTLRAAERYVDIQTLPFHTTKTFERMHCMERCRHGLEEDVKMFS